MPKIEEINKQNLEEETKDWKNISEEFTAGLREAWESRGFSYEETEKWINAGLQSSECELASYLTKQGYRPTAPNIKEIIKKESWKDIHEDFSYWVREDWEKKGFNKEETKEWIDLGLEPQWRQDNEFVLYVRGKSYKSSFKSKGEHFIQNKRREFKEWRETPKFAQEYLDIFYPKEKRGEVKILEIGGENLTGKLDLNDFVNLERLSCSSNKLTTLNLSNCTKLTDLDCNRNKLVNLNLSQNGELKTLYCGDNQFTTCDFLTTLSHPKKLILLWLENNNITQDLNIFSRFRNLEWLIIDNSPFYGSLAPLAQLEKLEMLEISDTDINSGVEYLPESLSGFNEYGWGKTRYFTHQRSDSKVQEIKLELDLFTDQELQKNWAELGFATDKEIKPWIETGLDVYEYDLVDYCQNKQNLSLSKIKDNLTELRKEYYKIGTEQPSAEIIKLLKDLTHDKIHSDHWIISLSSKQKSLFEQLIPNLEIRKRYEKYGMCWECNQPNTDRNWCQSCNSKRFQTEFKNWTSGNENIDQLIKEQQLKSTYLGEVLEWIPYEQFTEIEYLAKGGFGKIYKANWKEGPIDYWNTSDKKWARRENDKKVVLKILNNSQDITKEFLDEISSHVLFDRLYRHFTSRSSSVSPSSGIINCYGISQDSETKNYIMVMEYMEEGNLRQYLENKIRELTLKDKVGQLINISLGLKNVHQKNLVHRDFHSGNLLKGFGQTSCLITDLGLSRPANKENKEEEIFGVMPYVAPEVLQGQPYTQASDIYSFGIVAYEILTGLPPFHDMAHDVKLAVRILRGEKPQFNIKIPQLLEDLINRCWDADPLKRPTSSELNSIFGSWIGEYDRLKDDTEFAKQLKESEEFNKTLPEEIKYPDYKSKMHAGAVYHSKLINTKEITKQLQKLQVSKPMDNVEILEDYGKTEQVSQIEIPPK